MISEREIAGVRGVGRARRRLRLLAFRSGDRCQVGSSRRIRVSFVAEPFAVRAARGACEAAAETLPEDHRRRLAVVVTEVVSNAVRHGSTRATDPVGLGLEFSDSMVRVEVTDRGSGFDPPSAPRRGTLVGDGWGLALVDAMADRWGVSDGGTRSRVWAEIGRATS